MIVITAPTGDIGHQVLEHVIDSGEPTRLIARDPSRIPARIRERVEVVRGSHGDIGVVTDWVKFGGSPTTTQTGGTNRR